MKILFASMFCCIRAVKEGVALMEAGHDVHFLQNTVQNGPSILRRLKNLNFFGDFKEYQRKLISPEYDDIEIIHAHNEPDDLIFLAKAARPNVPVVYDCHDLASIAGRGDIEAEGKAMAVCDALVFPSEGYRRRAVENWGGVIYGKPINVIFPMCLREDQKRGKHFTNIPGVCYQGGLIGSEGSDDPASQRFHAMGATYRDHTELATEFASHNIPFYLYGVYPEIAPEYLELGAMCMGVLGYDKMIAQLSRFDWGFVGSLNPHSALEWAMPNKMFEYIAAGTPCVVMNCPEAGAFVEKHNVGIQVSSIEEFAMRYDEHHSYYLGLKKFLMEDQIRKVEDLYRTVLGSGA